MRSATYSLIICHSLELQNELLSGSPTPYKIILLLTIFADLPFTKRNLSHERAESQTFFKMWNMLKHSFTAPSLLIFRGDSHFITLLNSYWIWRQRKKRRGAMEWIGAILLSADSCELKFNLNYIIHDKFPFSHISFKSKLFYFPLLTSRYCQIQFNLTWSMQLFVRWCIPL